jgi:prepilin-type N-terminal cleavage/methylation domain-containing protein
MLSEKGFSLIEVLISLFILSTSVLAISHFFHQANEISTGNNNKLVATHLARMTLEKVKYDYSSFEITKTANHYDISICTTTQCERLFQPMINNIVYNIAIEVKSQTAGEEEINLFPIKVTVLYQAKQQTKSTTVEGYVTDAKKTVE